MRCYSVKSQYVTSEVGILVTYCISRYVFTWFDKIYRMESVMNCADHVIYLWLRLLLLHIVTVNFCAEKVGHLHECSLCKTHVKTLMNLFGSGLPRMKNILTFALLIALLN